MVSNLILFHISVCYFFGLFEEHMASSNMSCHIFVICSWFNFSPILIKRVQSHIHNINEKLIISQSKKKMENFIWPNLRIITWQTYRKIRGLLRRGKGKGQNIYDFGKGVHAIKMVHILVEGYYCSRGTDILVNGFSASLSMGTCEKLGS